MKDLGIKQRAAMFAFMAEGRQLSNTQLEQITGFRLTGKERKNLNKEGLVRTDDSRTPHRHTLTKDGLAWCEKELGAAPPQAAGSAGGALYAVLRGVRRYMDSTGLQLADIFKPEGTPGDPPPGDGVEERIRNAYRHLASKQGAWVGLANLRDRLAGVPRKDVDQALKRMISMPDVWLVPEVDQTLLTDRDRDAAVRIGGESKHALAIESR